MSAVTTARQQLQQTALHSYDDAGAVPGTFPQRGQNRAVGFNMLPQLKHGIVASEQRKANAYPPNTHSHCQPQSLACHEHDRPPSITMATHLTRRYSPLDYRTAGAAERIVIIIILPVAAAGIDGAAAGAGAGAGVGAAAGAAVGALHSSIPTHTRTYTHTRQNQHEHAPPVDDTSTEPRQ